MLAAFFILTFYCVVSSWFMAYIPFAVSGVFASDVGIVGESFQRFDSVTSKENLPLLLVYLAIFIGIAASVVGIGVKRGIERASTLLMPVFVLVLLVPLGFGFANGQFGEAMSFLTRVRAEDFSFSMLLDALAQSFFATGVGAAVMITYGAYLKHDADVPRSSAIVALADTAVALVAALVVFSLVFAVGSEPNGGFSLLFVNLPIGLAQMPLGNRGSAGRSSCWRSLPRWPPRSR